MGVTGWTGEGPDGGPAVPVTGFAGFIAGMRGDPADRPDALARAMHAPEPRDPEPRDPDEIAANLMVRGYPAGHVSDLAQRLADKRAELAGELEKIERGERATARARGMLERGQIGGLDAARMMDGDFGCRDRAEQLERQCANLQWQIADASALIAPQPERAPDPLEAASRHAHDVFVEVTRQRMAEMQAGVRRSESRPKEVSRSRGGVTARSEFCTWCAEFGATDQESYLLHSDPELNVPVTPPGTVPKAERERQVQAAESARLAVRPYGAGMAVR